jgi:DNA-binding NarL/FixJ family response regulator
VRIPFGTAHLAGRARACERRSPARGGAAQAFVQEALRWLPDDDSRAEVAHSTPERARRALARTFGARIVLADDNADMRTYVAACSRPLLGRGGRRRRGRARGRTARRRRPRADGRHDARLDGFGCSPRSAPTTTARVPVVLLSARAGEESRIEGLAAGADDYLTKPFSARELLARVGALLELDYMRRTGRAGVPTPVRAI